MRIDANSIENRISTVFSVGHAIERGQKRKGKNSGKKI
jgi:hypothetical protein